MLNVVWGIVVIIVCIAVYTCAWRYSKKDQYGTALVLIVIGGLILRIYVGADPFLHEWDERYHALVGKHFLQHWLKPTLYDDPIMPYNFKDWTTNHIWLHKQPLSLWLVGISIKLFGAHPVLARLPALLLSTFTIKLVFDIAANWYNKQVALIAAFLCSIHGQAIELASGRAGTDIVDTVFLFIVTLGVWLSIRAIRTKRLSSHLLLGAVIGLGILTKWLQALITLPIWAILAYPAFRGERRKMLLGAVATVLAIVAVALPWQLYILHQFPVEARWEYAYNSRHLTQALELHEGGAFYYFDHLRMKYGELIYLPVLWFTWYAFKKAEAQHFAVLAWFWLVYLFFSVVATKMEAYTLIAAPAVFIITGVTIDYLQHQYTGLARYRYVVLLAIILLLVLPVRYSIERVKPFTSLDRDPVWNQEINALKHSPQNNSKTVVFNCMHPIETMFATDCIAYEQGISQPVQDSLKHLGYTLLDVQRKY